MYIFIYLFIFIRDQSNSEVNDEWNDSYAPIQRKLFLFYHFLLSELVQMLIAQN